MFRRNVRTWLSDGGYFTPTLDTLFVSPERNALLNKFTQSPHDPGFVLDTLSSHGPKLGAWALESTPLLTDELVFGDRNAVFLPGLIPPLPFAGFGYFMKKGGILDQAVHIFNLLRTQIVAQLSFLIAPLTTDPGAPCRRFTHSRYNHMLDVAAMLVLICELLRKELTELALSLGFGEGELGFISLRNTLVTAGVIHDALTVAGGDGVKFVDPEAFDEDKLIVLLMGLGKYKGIFFDTWTINREALRLTIVGDKIEDPQNGAKKKKRYYLLNHILDLADKLAYTSRDVWQYIQRFGYNTEIGRIITEDPDVCTLWRSVKIVDGKLVVIDHERLGRFLRLRVLMFHHLYHGMVPRGGEMILGRCLCGFMYKYGEINLFHLLGNDDSWLGAKLASHLGVTDAVDSVSEAIIVAGAHKTSRQAHDILTREQDEEFLAFVEPFKSETKSATDRFFVEKDGRIGLFKDICPEEAALVDGIHDQDSGMFRGYGLDLRKLKVRTEVIRPLREFARRISSAS